MNGDIDEVINALITADQAEKCRTGIVKFRILLRN